MSKKVTMKKEIPAGILTQGVDYATLERVAGKTGILVEEDENFIKVDFPEEVDGLIDTENESLAFWYDKAFVERIK